MNNEWHLCPRCIRTARRRVVYGICYPDGYQNSCGSCLTREEREGVDAARKLRIQLEEEAALSPRDVVESQGGNI